MPSGAGNGAQPPDKRTTAYENIFGRPTAKPKGPVAQPPPSHAAPQTQYRSPQAGLYGPTPRWNGANGLGGPPGYPQGYPDRVQPSPQPPMSNYYGAHPGYQRDPIDRRASTTPSLSSQAGSEVAPMSGYYQPTSGVSAADAYYASAPQSAASMYASYYTSGAGGGGGPGGGGYSNPNAPSPAPSQRPLPPTGGPSEIAGGSAHPGRPSDVASSIYDGRQATGQGVENGEEFKEPPRLPSIELNEGNTNEFGWFNTGNGTGSPPTSPPTQAMSSLGLQKHEYRGNGQGADVDEEIYTSSAHDGGQDPYISSEPSYDFQNYKYGQQSAASSVYEGGRRRGSFESDRQSIANSIYTLPGAPSGADPRGFYSTASTSNSNFAPTGPGYFPGSGFGALMPFTAAQPNNWARPPRTRTTSSATQAAQAAYAPGYANSNAEWRKSNESARTRPNGRSDQRSMSFGQAAGRPSALTAPTSPHGSVGGSTPGQSSHRRGPLVYPALLSRVAEAFKTRVSVAERTKDGLAYKDAFDGREAVDRIAYIIKTTDRNLALLLGRALDAQKFFHDVTYDHRLRDSPNELYQFRQRLPSPFSSEDETFEDAQDGMYAQQNRLPVPPGAKNGPSRGNSASSSLAPSASVSSATSALSPSDPRSTPATSTRGSVANRKRRASVSSTEEDALPTGVFTLLTDCYSPTCTRDRLCYSIACPRRLEQQARLNMKPQPGLKRSISKESLGDVKERGVLWAESVSKEVFDSVSETERKRQEAINEVIYTERDFVRDLEYLRDAWIKPLRSKDIVPDAKRDDFVTQVFWNVLEIHAVNSRLAELMSKRQKQQAVVDRIGDILLEIVPHFQPFVKYGAHQLYGKYEFEKEKASNTAFSKFVDETERLPESRKLELNGYLTKPTTRLARYPLLLEQVVKHTADDNPDKQALPKVIKIVKEFLSKVNVETGKSENRFNLAQLDQQLVFKQGEAVDLRLRDEQRELVFKGPLKKRGGTQSESAELQVFLFDHALLMVKSKTVHKHDLYKVYRKPIPLELLIVTVYDEVPTGKGSTTRPKSVMSRTSTGNKFSNGTTGAAPKQDPKTGYALTFTYLGRKGYSMTLWASTFVSRRKWFEHIETRQEILRQRSNIFDTITLSESFFTGPNKVNCSVPFDFGRRIIYGTDDGVYLSDLREKARPPMKVLPLPGVTQVDVLEEYQILIILAERSVHTFTLDALDPSDPMGSLKRGRRISSHTSFFRAGMCLGRTLVCVVKSSSLSSTIKTLEPIEQNVRGKKQPTFRKLLQGGQDTLRVFKEFYIPTESSSIHFLKSKLCVGCTKGFEIVDLETLDTQGLLDPADSSLDFVQRRENVKPIAIYRIDGEFLLCYDEFAFYVNKNGWRAKGNWIIHWEGSPVSFAYHHPYVLAFEPNFIEVRHVETGALHQVITGFNLRCLFADVPPPSTTSHHQQTASNASALSLGSNSSFGGQPQSMVGPYGRPPVPPPGQYGYPGLSRQPSFGNMLGGGPAYPGGPPMPPTPYGPPGQMMYPGRPPAGRGMPYGFPQPAPPRPPQAQRNPVWESVAASRGQIVFIGDTTVFCVRLHSENTSTSTSSNGSTTTTTTTSTSTTRK